MFVCGEANSRCLRFTFVCEDQESVVFKNLGGLGSMAAMLGSVQQIPEKMKQLTENMKREVDSCNGGRRSGTGRDQRDRPDAIDPD
jgi:hypothetical protein